MFMDQFKNDNIAQELKKYNIEFIHFVDIAQLSPARNRGFPSAVLFGVKCTPAYLKRVFENPDYVCQMVERESYNEDEHYTHEMEMYRISDILSAFIEEKGYRAFSLSDANQIATDNFDGVFGKTLLPLKTLAVCAGLGWIGKNNLLVNTEYGCSQTWGAVLTDMPLETISREPSKVRCANCRVCVDCCEPGALKGKIWERGIGREEIIDVNRCTTCLKCMVHCPWTRRYMNHG